jgi:hypothetical protein
MTNEDQEMSQICAIDDAICKLQEARRFYDQPSPKFSQAEGCIEDAIEELNRIPGEWKRKKATPAW